MERGLGLDDGTDGSVEDLRRLCVSRGGRGVWSPCRLELEMEMRWIDVTRRVKLASQRVRFLVKEVGDLLG